MPRSEFTDCGLTDDRRVKVAGTVDADGPAHVHWLVEQGDLVASGVVTAENGTFEDVEARGQDWAAGESATALGLQVGVGRSASGRAGLATFTWSQPIDL